MDFINDSKASLSCKEALALHVLYDRVRHDKKDEQQNVELDDIMKVTFVDQ